jgi:hypothetical protein
MIGDSVDRNNLRFFCELVNSTKMRVTPMTNLSEASLGDTDLDPSNADPGDLTKPRICRIEEYDFEIINFFHYGMQDREIWREKNVYTPPGVIEKRIPLLKNLFADYGRKPDMIIMASGSVLTIKIDRRPLGSRWMGKRGRVRRKTGRNVNRPGSTSSLAGSSDRVHRHGFRNVPRRIHVVANITLLCRMSNLLRS